MADRINNVPAKKPETETPTVVDSNNSPNEAADKKIDRIANRAAEKASKTEKQFDEGHTTFSNI